MPQKIIVVTGFGPFVGHEERNASWEAVNLLPDVFPFRKETYELRKHKVPVTYAEVDRIVPLIWNQQPDLVVHVGVHGQIHTINLEHCSYTSGYCKPDFAKCYLPCDKITLSGKHAAAEGCTMLKTNLNIDRIAKELNLETNVQCCCSTEVGNYLCGYIYLKSLDVNPDRALFIHVPKVNEPYSSEQTMATIYNVIGKCLEQLSAEQKLS
ncbi:pyroglutamyl-peptidase 1 [Anopheles maculipalpis]|uniref:pyroglutamyl-peptidase 1 n=1 Tax=Anopheles maculipalpis TaxID=1496333 RepID=UPI0021593A62|nr:pyroglutamyl-peptidase 1 [Anopheles maculipalpis]